MNIVRRFHVLLPTFESNSLAQSLYANALCLVFEGLGLDVCVAPRSNVAIAVPVRIEDDSRRHPDIIRARFHILHQEILDDVLHLSITNTARYARQSEVPSRLQSMEALSNSALCRVVTHTVIGKVRRFRQHWPLEDTSGFRELPAFMRSIRTLCVDLQRKLEERENENESQLEVRR